MMLLTMSTSSSMGWVAMMAIMGVVVMGKVAQQDGGVHTESLNHDIVIQESLMKRIGGKLELESLLKTHSRLSAKELLNLLLKVNDLDSILRTSKQPVMALLDVADAIHKREEQCDSKKSVDVSKLVNEGSIADVQKRLLTIHNGWKCNISNVLDNNEKSDASSDFLGVMGSEMFNMLRKSLKANPKLASKMVIEMLKSQKWLAKEHTPLAMLLAEGLTGSELFINLTLTTLDGVDTFMRSESGRRIFKILPELRSASSEHVLELLQREAEYSQDAFFAQMENSDLSRVFVKYIARICLSVYNGTQSVIQDDLKFTVINSMLIANKWPIIDRKQVLQSSIRLVEKLLTYVTTSKSGEMHLAHHVDDLVKEFEKHYFKLSKLAVLSEKEVENLMADFFQENLLEPIKNVWVANRGFSDLRCAKYVICLYNEQYKAQSEIRKTVARALSTAMAYSWSSLPVDDEEHADDYWDLYNAFWAAYEDNDLKKDDDLGICRRRFVLDVGLDDTCNDVFEEARRRAGLMLSYDHNEL